MSTMPPIGATEATNALRLLSEAALQRDAHFNEAPTAPIHDNTDDEKCLANAHHGCFSFAQRLSGNFRDKKKLKGGGVKDKRDSAADALKHEPGGWAGCA